MCIRDSGWTFLGKAKAMECVESGHCYAAIVIPRNFSENMAAVITGSGQRPTLEYYVNEKVNAVAPKMTDVGANTVDRQVNSAFVSTVSKAVTDTINTTNVQIDVYKRQGAGFESLGGHFQFLHTVSSDPQVIRQSVPICSRVRLKLRLLY